MPGRPEDGGPGRLRPRPSRPSSALAAPPSPSSARRCARFRPGVVASCASRAAPPVGWNRVAVTESAAFMTSPCALHHFSPSRGPPAYLFSAARLCPSCRPAPAPARARPEGASPEPAGRTWLESSGGRRVGRRGHLRAWSLPTPPGAAVRCDQLLPASLFLPSLASRRAVRIKPRSAPEERP